LGKTPQRLFLVRKELGGGKLYASGYLFIIPFPWRHVWPLIDSTVGFRDFRLPCLISAQMLGEIHVLTLLLLRKPRLSEWFWNPSASCGA